MARSIVKLQHKLRLSMIVLASLFLMFFPDPILFLLVIIQTISLLFSSLTEEKIIR